MVDGQDLIGFIRFISRKVGNSCFAVSYWTEIDVGSEILFLVMNFFFFN